MAAYLVYICQSVSDRKELETYWKDMPRTLMGFDIKLHTAYRPFQLLEGEGPVEGVVVAGFPSMQEGQEVVRQPGIRRGAPAPYARRKVSWLACRWGSYGKYR